MRKIMVYVNDINELTAIVAGLTREGLAFTCELKANNWEIEITGS